MKSDSRVRVDFEDLKAKLDDEVAGMMLTQPNTLGLFEDQIEAISEEVHKSGGLMYMDGANMNAQVGLTSPGFIGADVCHLNLHKTFNPKSLYYTRPTLMHYNFTKKELEESSKTLFK